MTKDSEKVLVPVAVVITTREFDEKRDDYVLYISHGVDLETGQEFCMVQEPVNIHPEIKFSELFNEYVLMGEQK